MGVAFGIFKRILYKNASDYSGRTSWKLISIGTLLLILMHLLHVANRALDDRVDRFKRLLLANAQRKISERRAWLSRNHSEGSFFSALKSDRLFYMFSPYLPCFWTLEKQPSSTQLHDGGKWLCGLHEVHTARSKSGVRYGVGQSHYHHRCIVYSFGSNNEFSFEQRVRTIAPGCEIHTFDPTVPETGEGRGAYDFYHGDYGFGGFDSPSGPFPVKAISTIMKELKHDHVDYLKVDVEGYEWEFLSTVDWDSTKVGQILVELHPGKRGMDPTAKDMNAIFTKLEDAGYFLISLEPVTYTNIGQVELVFFHKDWQP